MATDYAFALRVYLSTMRPYTEELMVWDEQKQIASFAKFPPRQKPASFNLDEVLAKVSKAHAA